MLKWLGWSCLICRLRSVKLESEQMKVHIDPLHLLHAPWATQFECIQPGFGSIVAVRETPLSATAERLGTRFLSVIAGQMLRNQCRPEVPHRACSWCNTAPRNFPTYARFDTRPQFPCCRALAPSADSAPKIRLACRITSNRLSSLLPDLVLANLAPSSKKEL